MTLRTSETIGSPATSLNLEGYEWAGRPDFDQTSMLLPAVIRAFESWSNRPVSDFSLPYGVVAPARGQDWHFRSLRTTTMEKIRRQVADGTVASMGFVLSTGPDQLRGELYADVTLVVGGAKVPVPRTAAAMKYQRPSALVIIYRRDRPTARAHAIDDYELFDAMTLEIAAIITPERGWGHTGAGPIPVLEAIAPRQGTFDPMRELRDRLHGYDWLQLLTPGVIEALHRAGRDLADLPAETVRRVPFADGSIGALAAIRKSPYDVTTDDMRAFRNFMLPVMYLTGPPHPTSHVATARALQGHVERPPNILPEDWFAD